MENSILLEAIIFLTAAVCCVPLAKKFGFSSILGYLLAGMLIGPSALGLIGERGEEIMHFAEFGVVMMLFLIGLELDPHKFWKLRRFIAGMGSIQVVGTALILFFGFLALGWSWQTSLAVALALALSSTAIVLQTLKEKDTVNTSHGRSAFAVLLFQDIMVIPILAVIPLLAAGALASDAQPLQNSFIASYPGWLQTLIILGSISALYLVGRFVVVPLLRIVARTRIQELFTASALLIVLAVSYLMSLVGLSPALGAFMAGVLLANSEFRHELESDIAPFKGLLLGLFFIGVGVSINFNHIIDDLLFITAFVGALTVIKFCLLYLVGLLYKKHTDQNLQFSIALSQAGEFGFVIISFSASLLIVPADLAAKVTAVIALSMLLTPLLTAVNERYILPRIGTREAVDDDDGDDIDDEKNEVVIAGFGHFGGAIGRLLRTNNKGITVLDHDADRVEVLRKMGFKVYYGDATRLNILRAAISEDTRLFIAAIDNPQINLGLVETVRKHFPRLKILARARNRVDAYELVDHGIENFYRETLYTAVHLGVDALMHLGVPEEMAARQGERFISYDEASIRRLAEKRHDKMAYMVSAKEEIELQEEMLKRDIYELQKNNSDQNT